MLLTFHSVLPEIAEFYATNRKKLGAAVASRANLIADRAKNNLLASGQVQVVDKVVSVTVAKDGMSAFVTASFKDATLIEFGTSKRRGVRFIGRAVAGFAHRLPQININ